MRSTYETLDLQANAGGYESDIATQMLKVKCTFCGKPLILPESLERGSGEDCDAYYMGGAGEAAAWDALSHADLDEVASILRDAPNVAPTRWMQVIRAASKGDLLFDGSEAKGGEVLESRPLNVPGLKDYWISKGGEPDDPNAAWRRDPAVLRRMVSAGIWYASRAVTFGYDEFVVGAQKIDPKWAVVASVQRFTRAVGLDTAANQMTAFYAVRVSKAWLAEGREERREARQKREEERRNAIVFEQVRPSHPNYRGDPFGEGVVRVSTPYSDKLTRLARANKDILFAFEKDPPYFWRYFMLRDLRKVINMIQEVFGDAMSITRPQTDRGSPERNVVADRVAVMDVDTGEVRYLTPANAEKLVEMAMVEITNTKGETTTKLGRYRIVEV